MTIIKDTTGIAEKFDDVLDQAYAEVYNSEVEPMIEVRSVQTNRTNTIRNGVLAKRVAYVTIEVAIHKIYEKMPKFKDIRELMSQVEESLHTINMLSEYDRYQSMRSFSKMVKKVLKENRSVKKHQERVRLNEVRNDMREKRFIASFVKSKYGYFQDQYFKTRTFEIAIEGEDLDNRKYLLKKVKNRILNLSNSNIETI